MKLNKILIIYIMMIFLTLPNFVYASIKDTQVIINDGGGGITTNSNTSENTINYGNLCADYNSGIGNAVRIIGYVVEVAKWIIPLLIIVLGMVDFGKATISSDENELKKATASLARRFIAGVVVFLIPEIILALLSVTEISNDIENTTRFSACTKCILDASDNCPITTSS